MCGYFHLFLVTHSSKQGNRTRRLVPRVSLVLGVNGRLFREPTGASIPERLSARLPLINDTKVQTHHATFAAPLFRGRLGDCVQAVERIRASLRQIVNRRRYVTVLRLARWGVGVAVRVSRCGKWLETGHGLSKPRLRICRRRKVRVELMAWGADTIRLRWDRKRYLLDRRLLLVDWLSKDSRKISQEKLDQRSGNVKSRGEDNRNCFALVCEYQCAGCVLTIADVHFVDIRAVGNIGELRAQI